MTEEKLNEKYIRGKISGICQDCIYLDKIVPIIREMLSQSYVDGLRQSKFDYEMDKLALQEEIIELKEKLELLNKMNEDNYNKYCDTLKKLKEKGELIMEKKLKMTEEENFMKMFEGARCAIVSTSNGVGIEGSTLEVLSSLSQLIHSIRYDSGIDKQQIINSVELGLRTKEEIDEKWKDLFSNKEEIKEMLQELKEIFFN